MKSKHAPLMAALWLGALVMVTLPATAPAIETLIETVAQGCKAELETYCAKVTPGEGRELACLYAHEDKVSGRCDYALYDAAARLEHAVTSMAYVGSECHADLEKYCATIVDEHLLACLEKHHEQVRRRCTEALKDVGMTSHWCPAIPEARAHDLPHVYFSCERRGEFALQDAPRRAAMERFRGSVYSRSTLLALAVKSRDQQRDRRRADDELRLG